MRWIQNVNALRDLRGPFQRYLAAVVFVVAAVVVRLLFFQALGSRVAWITFYPAVVLAALYGGLGPGLLATACSAVLGDFLWIEPVGSLAIRDFGDLLSLGIFTCNGALVSCVTEAMRRARLRAAVAEADARVAAAVRESESRLAAFVSAMFEGLVESEAGRIVDCNEQFAEMAGCSVAELKGTAILDLIPPEDRQRVAANIGLNHESLIEHAMLRPDGARIVVEARGRAAASGGTRRYTSIRDISQRKRVEQLLVQANQRWQALMDALPVGVSYSDDPSCQRITGNPAVLAQFEMSASDNLSASAPDAAAAGRQVQFFQEGRPIMDAELPLQRAVAENRQIPPMELEVRLPSGSHWFAEASGAPVRDHAGNVIGGVAVTVDITERKRAELFIKESLAEKEVLLKEVHHRVKNNMQVISSLLALQAERLVDDAMRAVLADATHRVRSMALVHEALYQSDDLAHVDFADYAESLLNYIWSAHGPSAAGTRLVLDLQPVRLAVNAAVPCGLILNELASNALKHAFGEQATGREVTVTLWNDAEDRICLRVRDNGAGLPPGLDWRQANTLGLRLVQMLAGQLDAEVQVASGNGTEFAIAFAAKPNPKGTH
jgi:PAS domain S-box-containing protein